MALFMKQDFSPPLLSRRWLAIKFRPNMLINSRGNIISILESGLLFREDSIEVEQNAPAAEEVWDEAGGGRSGWMTRGETVAAAVGVSACVMVFPPRHFHRSTLLNLATYLSVPIVFRLWHRHRCRGSIPALLEVMRLYLALARRTAACLKEYAALHAQIGSLSSVIESTHTLLCRQQSELSVLMARASSAVLGNSPWLRDDLAWDAVQREPTDNLMKIHHAFLVVQSTLLKHIAMAHYVPSKHSQRLYKNHNERIYWIHSVVLELIAEEMKQNYDALERMYRLLKNSANKVDEGSKKLRSAVKCNWVYSEIHTGVAKSCLELKLALNNCNSLDVFLDSCALNNQPLDLDILSRDIDLVIDNLTNCLSTMQNAQLRLKKLQHKPVKDNDIEANEIVVDDSGVLKLDDKNPESKDEVFYFVKTDKDDVELEPADVTTAPGKKERDTTKLVLNELRRKLGKREDLMRERERQALAKTMPELKDVPDFPRQIDLNEFVEKVGYIRKIKLDLKPERKLRSNLKKLKVKKRGYRLETKKYSSEIDINGVIYEANARLNVKSRLVTFDKPTKLTKWVKVQVKIQDVDSNSILDDVSDEIESKEIRVTKRDLELSTSESDFEFYNEKELEVLKDVRKNRVVRKKRYPVPRSLDVSDEGLKPIEYTFGTGMAMASVLQVNKRLPFMGVEEVFVGDGEVSTDSGNDEDA